MSSPISRATGGGPATAATASTDRAADATDIGLHAEGDAERITGTHADQRAGRGLGDTPDDHRR
ncbi:MULTISPECIES: hypothetical protein [Methylobacterium]|uniref:Uncharacterized protein n=1 Tax=Methylobacterium longum TaxID=767694 RepID=A0ABT8AI74_9HYPH|nr:MULTISPECIES: hypothetical protein [Methylobacterium]MCJ2100939.1 hypothetical protein [Methylobacterium sp. E-046]MDN3569161.1 hypothetical protein [Methylobacterium longum]